jgi:hypothetical protein
MGVDKQFLRFSRMSDTMTLPMRPKKPPTKQIRFREDLAKKLEFIGLHKGQDTPDLTDALFRAIIEREFSKTLERLSQLDAARKAAGE